MKAKTKKEMELILKNKEAKLWDSVNLQRDWCKHKYGEGSEESTWSESDRILTQMYTSEWVLIHQLLKELGIEAFTYMEKLEQKKQTGL